MSKDSSAKYSQDNKKTTEKSCESSQNLSKEEKEKKKRNHAVVTNTKTYQKMKNKSWLIMKKSIPK